MNTFKILYFTKIFLSNQSLEKSEMNQLVLKTVQTTSSNLVRNFLYLNLTKKELFDTKVKNRNYLIPSSSAAESLKKYSDVCTHDQTFPELCTLKEASSLKNNYNIQADLDF